MGEGRQHLHAVGLERHAKEGPHHGHLRVVPHLRRAEGRGVRRRLRRQLEVHPEAAHGRDVVILDDDAAVGQLRLEVVRDGGAAKRKGADDRVPVGAVGMNAEDTPAGIVFALDFKRTEDDAAILEHDRVQGLADVQVADLFDVGAVVVHDEQLQRPLREARRLQAVAVADEGDPAPRQRAGVHVADPPGGGRLPVGDARVGRPLLLREAHGPARLDVDLADVGAPVAADVVEVRVVDQPFQGNCLGFVSGPFALVE